MLGLAKRLKIEILQALTSEIYRGSNVHPKPEGYWENFNTLGPRACYNEGKGCTKTLFFDYHRQHGLKIKVMRIFNTYGPRMYLNDRRVISNFIVRALKGDEITIYGDGSQTRCFYYVDDTIDGLLKMMESSNDFTGPVNIGNPVECSILSLVNSIHDLTDSKSRII